MTEVRKHRRQTASGKTTTVRHHTRKGGDGEKGGGQQERFLLTVRSRSGRRVNMITGAPEDTIMVYGRADLERRIRAAEADPDYEVSYRDPPAPHVLSLPATERAEPDWSWLDGEDEPAGDFWADDEPGTCGQCGCPLNAPCRHRCIGDHAPRQQPGGETDR